MVQWSLGLPVTPKPVQKLTIRIQLLKTKAGREWERETERPREREGEREGRERERQRERRRGRERERERERGPKH